ncbi:MAG: TonB-dependent receptor, partial [Bacteroidetes bacterium]|nr:TonB-dependent receptor [Bacteroidota bacterium]
GKSYGLEILMQQKLSNTIYGIISYTWVRSEFQDKTGKYIPSAWDNQHILNIAAGKKLKRNWEAGMKFRLLGGAPYTPYNIELSSLKTVWDVTRTGILDWNRLNTLRNQVSHGLDIRVDKRWYFRKWALDLYLDIQNIYNFKSKGLGYLDVQRDINGNLIENPNNPDAYLTKEIENTNGTILPSIGIMIEF